MKQKKHQEKHLEAFQVKTSEDSENTEAGHPIFVSTLHFVSATITTTINIVGMRHVKVQVE